MNPISMSTVHMHLLYGKDDANYNYPTTAVFRTGEFSKSFLISHGHWEEIVKHEEFRKYIKSMIAKCELRIAEKKKGGDSIGRD